MDRFTTIQNSGPYGFVVYEVHGRSQDGRDWLSQVVKFANKKWPYFQQQHGNAFSKTATCAIRDCDRLVEVGALLTIHADELLIVPCCKAHNTPGTLDKLGRQCVLKAYQSYGEITVKPGLIAKKTEDGTFYLTRALRNLVDE